MATPLLYPSLPFDAVSRNGPGPTLSILPQTRNAMFPRAIARGVRTHCGTTSRRPPDKDDKA